MAYVALSRVRTLSGVHLIEFDQYSIFVCSKSLQEFNRPLSKIFQQIPSVSDEEANTLKERYICLQVARGIDKVRC